MLCHECRAIFDQPPTFVRKKWQLDRWEAQFEYDVSSSGLELKAMECYACRSLLRQLRTTTDNPHLDIQADTTIRISSSLVVPADERGGRPQLWNQMVLDGKTLGRSNMWLETVQPNEEATNSGSSTGSTDTLQFVRTCLNTCRTQHKACSPAIPGESSPAWYPTRLVEVRRESLRLVESAEFRISGPYATLSHCWGKADILKLTQSNLEELKIDISFAQLPQTFQDAVRVVRSLGLDYIWIDSLCIIQDSKNDWDKEALTMLKVYQQALCNIAATHSANSFGGLFRTRNSPSLGSGTMDLDNHPALKGASPFCLIDKDYFTQEIDDAPLNRRSWVMQERVLSKRIIHFASEQVFWDCPELTACESLPQGTQAWPSSRMKMGCKQGSDFLSPPFTIDKGLGQWATIVNGYSACGLTFLGDKPIAILGVADYLRNELQIDYCAGLWRPKMEMQLAWYVKALQPGVPPRNHLAPSWSWMSINGSVDLPQIDLYEGYTVEPLVSITEVNLYTEGREPPDDGLGSHLRMLCSLNPVTLTGSPQDLTLQGKGMEHARNTSVDSPEVIAADRLFFVPLFDVQMEMSLEDKWNISSEIRGIIVQGVEGRPGTYTRCGHVFLSDAVREDTRAFGEAYEGMKSPAGKGGLPCEEYDPDLGHLIRLI